MWTCTMLCPGLSAVVSATVGRPWHLSSRPPSSSSVASFSGTSRKLWDTEQAGGQARGRTVDSHDGLTAARILSMHCHSLGCRICCPSRNCQTRPEMAAARVSEHRLGRQYSVISPDEPLRPVVYREYPAFDCVSSIQFNHLHLYRSLYSKGEEAA